MPKVITLHLHNSDFFQYTIIKISIDSSFIFNLGLHLVVSTGLSTYIVQEWALIETLLHVLSS